MGSRDVTHDGNRETGAIGPGICGQGVSVMRNEGDPVACDGCQDQHWQTGVTRMRSTIYSIMFIACLLHMSLRSLGCSAKARYLVAIS